VFVRALPIVVLALMVSGCGSSSLSSPQLKKEIESIQSFAAEGSTLAQGAAESRSTTIFVRVHSQYLEQGAKKVGTKLDQAQVASDLEPKRAQAVKLVSEVEQDLDSLHRDPGNRELAHRIQLELSSAADDAEQLAK
jgi:hypothetical protein